MVELVYTHDLKSCPLWDAGSIPALGTRIIKAHGIHAFYIILVKREEANCFAFVGDRRAEHVALQQRVGVASTYERSELVTWTDLA